MSSDSKFPYACPYCGRANTTSAPGNACGRTSCNAMRSANKNIVQPLVNGLSGGLSKGVDVGVKVDLSKKK